MNTHAQIGVEYAYCMAWPVWPKVLMYFIFTHRSYKHCIACRLHVLPHIDKVAIDFITCMHVDSSVYAC